MKPGVVILGGFNATETAYEQRDWEAYPTILSGDIGISGDSTDNSYHLLYTLGTDSTSRIDGFTIAFGQGIHANSNYFGHYNGGGGLFVDTDTAHPTAAPGIANCTFFRNTAKNGGAVHLKNGANPIFRNCAFRQNRSTLLGGGMYKDGTASEEQPFVLENCLFEQNRARAEGGGLALNNACENHRLLRCIFRSNYAMSDGAGIYYFSNCPQGEIKIEECLFEFNDGAVGGGIGYIQGTVPLPQNTCQITITHSIFNNNNARASGGGAIEVAIISEPRFHLILNDCKFEQNASLNPGGALYFFTETETPSDLSIKNCVFIGNTNVTAEGTGGAIMASGFFNQAYNNILIANSLFLKNSGVLRLDTGDGILDASLRNCTFYDNGRRPFVKYWAPEFDEDFFLAMRFENCIIWEPNKPLNRLFTNGANVVMNGFSFRNSLLSVPACDLPGGPEACAENNLFNLYPRFLDTLAGDFRLAACSPAINAGAYTGLDTLGIQTDLNGAARIQEGIEDMGAFEQPADTIQAVFHIQHASAAQVADGSLSLISIEGGVPPYLLSWSFGNSGDTLSNLLPGIYPVTVSDSSGCSVTYALEVSAPNAGQPSLEEKNSSFRLRPNPFTGTVILTNDHLPTAISSTGVVVLYDAFGREVLREPLRPINGRIKQELDLAHLAAGAYFCAIEVAGIVLWRATAIKQ
ncbi:MAG: hypothetical protein HUU01_24065 [Saprospiraceae bacterium]|nr:hypothetical protein [Saprospiraceae bacterium]